MPLVLFIVPRGGIFSGLLPKFPRLLPVWSGGLTLDLVALRKWEEITGSLKLSWLSVCIQSGQCIFQQHPSILAVLPPIYLSSSPFLLILKTAVS